MGWARLQWSRLLSDKEGQESPSFWSWPACICPSPPEYTARLCSRFSSIHKEDVEPGLFLGACSNQWLWWAQVRLRELSENQTQNFPVAFFWSVKVYNRLQMVRINFEKVGCNSKKVQKRIKSREWRKKCCELPE